MCMKRAARYTKNKTHEDDLSEELEDEMEDLEEGEDLDDEDYYDEDFDEDFNDDTYYDHDTYDDGVYDDSWYYPDDDRGRNVFVSRASSMCRGCPFAGCCTTCFED